MGMGTGKGKTRAVDAAQAAISSPLLDFPITRAKGIVFNIAGGSDMTLQEVGFTFNKRCYLFFSLLELSMFLFLFNLILCRLIAQPK